VPETVALLKALGAAGQQRDAVSGGTELAGAGQSQSGTGADEGVGGYDAYS
jgi:hypothetical protein